MAVAVKKKPKTNTAVQINLGDIKTLVKSMDEAAKLFKISTPNLRKKLSEYPDIERVNLGGRTFVLMTQQTKKKIKEVIK